MTDEEILETAGRVALGIYLSDYPDTEEVPYEAIVEIMEEHDTEDVWGSFPMGVIPWEPFEDWSSSRVAKEIRETRWSIYEAFRSQRVRVWGNDEGFCAWCVDAPAPSPVWEDATDSQGEEVSYACCQKCAADRGVEVK